MKLQTICAAFPGLPGSDALARFGAATAAQHRAHLTGVHVVPDFVGPPATFYDVPAELIESARAEQLRVAQVIKERFESAAERESVAFDWLGRKEHDHNDAYRFTESSRAADLIITLRPTGGSYDPDFLQGQLIKRTGRPVLVVSEDQRDVVHGKRVVIGYSPTREATRAAFDALALLDEGAEITLLNVSDAGDELNEGPLNALAATLDRHGFKVTVTHRHRTTQSIPEFIQREAQEIGADFIAVGAYGHSPFYDFIIGAVTTHLLREAEMPVLFSK